MKKRLYEAQKNYMTCGVLMIAVGLGMLYVGKENMGYGCIALGVLFEIIFAVLLKKMGFMLVDEESATSADANADEKATKKLESKDEKED